jgi:type IV pilus assembly protein PilM
VAKVVAGRVGKQASNQNKRLKNLYAVDFGTATIRLCRFKPGIHSIDQYSEKSLVIDPQMSVEEQRELRLEALNELFDATGAKHKNVICGLPGRSVFTRYRWLPPLPEHKVLQVVRYEIQQQIPFALYQRRLDYQIMGRMENGSYDVLMAAVKSDVVDQQLAVFKDAGCKVRYLTVNPVAAYNWLRFVGEIDSRIDGETIALIDLGASGTNLVIERAGQFRFTRPINIGGNDITRAVQKALKLNSFSAAESVKCHEVDSWIDNKDIDTFGIYSVLEELAEEIKRSFAYFCAKPGGKEIERVLLIGGGSKLAKVETYLTKRLGVEVRLANPLAGLVSPKESYPSSQMATVLGLALQTQREVAVKFDFVRGRTL